MTAVAGRDAERVPQETKHCGLKKDRVVHLAAKRPGKRRQTADHHAKKADPDAVRPRRLMLRHKLRVAKPQR